MKVSQLQVVDFDVKTRYIKTLTDDPSESEGDKIERKFRFLTEVVNDGLYQGLLNAGPKGFDTLSMSHNGKAWVIQIESEVFK